MGSSMEALLDPCLRSAASSVDQAPSLTENSEAPEYIAQTMGVSSQIQRMPICTLFPAHLASLGNEGLLPSTSGQSTITSQHYFRNSTCVNIRYVT